MGLLSGETYTYGGDVPDEITTGFCTKCKQEHTLPNKEWIMIRTATGKMKLACSQSEITNINVRQQIIDSALKGKETM